MQSRAPRASSREEEAIHGDSSDRNRSREVDVPSRGRRRARPSAGAAETVAGEAPAVHRHSAFVPHRDGGGAGGHYLGRRLLAQGHDVRLMPAQYVRPYVKSSHKNDILDAEGIDEAVQRPTMRFVPLKTPEQLDLQALHRVRDRLVARRTSVINQLRAFLFERGITIRQGRRHLEEQLPQILEDADNDLSARMRALLRGLQEEWKTLEADIARVEEEIERLAAHDDACQRLAEIPGVGPLVATALVAAVGNATSFAKGRDLAAWLGLGPTAVLDRGSHATARHQ